MTIHANQQVFHWAPPDSRRKLCLYQSDAAESSRLAPLSTRMSVTAFCSKFADSRLFGQASPRGRLQNLGTASLPNLNRMRHHGFHKSINWLLFATESRRFHNFIIITMILPFPHNSAFRWEEVLGVLTFRRFPCTMIYAP